MRVPVCSMLTGVLLASSPVLGVVPQVSVSHGIEFATVGDPGNPGFDGNALFQRLAGAGSIPYEYRLSRTEITAGQWIEFANAIAGLGPEWSRFSDLVSFPCTREWLPNGGLRYTLVGSIPDVETIPVRGMSFAHAALYANWLHNGKAASLDAIRTGAYDLTGVGVAGIHLTGPELTYEQMQPLPGAKFWVPSIGEWMKGGFYDPDKNGTGPGWWNYANSKDRLPVYGAPGDGGESNAGVLSNPNPYYVPGSVYYDFPAAQYPDQQSPWGLLDISGGAYEFTSGFDAETYGITEGAAIFGTSISSSLQDAFFVEHATMPQLAGISAYMLYPAGLRLAASVPEAPSFLLLCVAGPILTRRRSRP